MRFSFAESFFGENRPMMFSWTFEIDTENPGFGTPLVLMFVEYENYIIAGGLLLERTTGPRGEYRRVGIFHIWTQLSHHERWSSWFTAFLQWYDLNHKQTELTEDDYESIDKSWDDGADRYRITLV